jgi:ParB family chromosome partitioning protein
LQLFTPFKTRSDHPDRIRDGFISMGHGRAIINIEDLDIQTDIYQRIVSQNLSVRDTEVKNYQESLKPKPAVKTKASSAFEIQETQKKVLLIILEAK